MLRDSEPDYEMDIKPYKPSKPAESWETAEPQQEKIEPKEVDRLIEQTESSPVENEMLTIKSENIWEPVETQPVDTEPRKKVTDSEPVY